MTQFNQDQIVNLIQTVGKIGGAVIGTYGAQAGNVWAAGVGFVTALVSWWFSHHSNATQAPSPSTVPIAK